MFYYRKIGSPTGTVVQPFPADLRILIGNAKAMSPADNTIDLTSPTLSWTSSPNATSYQYCFSPNIGDNNCAYLSGWRDVGNITSYTLPKDARFIWGSKYYWQIRASNTSGTTLANEGVWWTFTTANLIGKASLLSPAGAITDYTPTCHWNHKAGVSWYYLWIDGPGGNLYKQWHEAAAICSGATCELTPSLGMRSGNYTWWVQMWNATGYGPWSDSLTFSLPAIPLPGAATLISPSGSITSATPAYTWNQLNSSTWYYLWVNNAAGAPVIQQWYSAVQICGSSVCSATPGVMLPAGDYTWWIQTWNDAGYGPWSNGKVFSVP